MSASPVITRFAPSPTGHLHIGGARTALFCWAFARRQGGRFMIRIEDTDQARSSEASARGILNDLAWLGIEWDDGPRLEYHGRVIGAHARDIGGSYFQAQRVEIYNQYIDALMAAGRAYPAFETADELDALRKAATARKHTFKYPRPADVQFGVAPRERIARVQRGEAHVVRFVMPDTPVVVIDDVLGEVKYAAGEVDDFVIRKADGFPTYHFAVVIDDELMGVTHVLRGQEHLNNTPRHVALQQGLKRLDTGAPFRTPVYAHMPLIFNMDSSKMSKRDKDKAGREACKKAGLTTLAAVRALPAALASPEATAALGALTESQFAAWMEDTKSQLPADALRAVAERVRIALPEVEVEDFKRAGYLPEVICNFISLLGWSPGGDLEKFDQAYLASHFDIARIGKTNARFDRVKLLAFNTDAVTKMPPERFDARFKEWAAEYAPALVALPADLFTMLCAAVQPRCKTFKDAADQAAFLMIPDDAVVFDPKAVEKNLRADGGAGLAVLRAAADALRAVEPFTPAAIHAAIEALAAAKAGGQMGKVAQPLRVALTGSTVSPPIDLTLALLGRERAMKRIARCVSQVA